MAKNVYSVRQVNAYIKNMFVQDFMLNRIYVKGEVSNCKYHTSGHIYFSLKDESGAIACVMFAGERRKGSNFPYAGRAEGDRAGKRQCLRAGRAAISSMPERSCRTEKGDLYRRLRAAEARAGRDGDVCCRV